MDAPRTIVTLRGELDIYRAESIRDSFAAIDGPAVVDLSGVTYLDSTALNELARLHKRVGDLVIVAPSPQIRRVLTIVGFAHLFTIVDDISRTA